MRPILLTSLFLAALLAGCSDDPTPEGPEVICDDCGTVTATTGVIRGVVVDQAIIPIEGVTVRIASVDLETQTDADGVFFFDDLEPGTYFLEVSKPGYDSVQASVEVQAGVEPSIQRIQIAFQPGAQPYYEILPFRGHLQCNVVAYQFFMPCTIPLVGPVGDDDYENEWDFTQDADHVQAVLVWKATQSFGTELYLNIYEPGDYDIVAWGGGLSPVVVDANATQLAPINAADKLAIEVSGNGESVVDNQAGVAVDQGFEVYAVVFYNFVPDEGYNYYEDGEPTPPS